MQNSIKAYFESSTFKGRPWRLGVSNYCWVGVVAAAAHWKQQRGGKSAPEPTRRYAVSSTPPCSPVRLWTSKDLLDFHLAVKPDLGLGSLPAPPMSSRPLTALPMGALSQIPAPPLWYNSLPRDPLQPSPPQFTHRALGAFLWPTEPPLY